MNLTPGNEQDEEMLVKEVKTNDKSFYLGTADFGYGFATIENPVWTLSDVLRATGGKLINRGDEAACFRSISTDSRNIEPGDLFLALSGDTFDGHAFIQGAISKGAAGIIISKRSEISVPVPVVMVKDTLEALGKMASYRRARIPDLKVFAITGSSGKTTVKEMLAAILQRKCNILKTKGNFNNLVGLPLSLLPVSYRHRFAVLEMGMNRPGEIARLTDIADPDIGCIVNVQEAHLEGLHDIERVAQAKGELFNGMKENSVLAVNVDDKRVRFLARRCRQKKVMFGRNRKAFVRATHIKSRGEEGMAFTLHIGVQKGRVAIRALGNHNVINAVAAAAMAYGAGFGFTDIVRGLADFMPYEKRMQFSTLRNGIRILNDTYNANPASMHAALETAAGLRQGCKTVAVLGDMLELGEKSRACHRSLGERVALLGFDCLLAVGDFAGQVVEGALAGGMKNEEAVKFGSKEALGDHLTDLVAKGWIASGDLLLFKGSRGMKMETVITTLVNNLGIGAA